MVLLVYQKHVHFIIDVQTIDIKKSETTLRWNDPELNINWGIKNQYCLKKTKEVNYLKKLKMIYSYL